MDFNSWIRQPSTITGLGALAAGVVGALAQYFAGNPQVSAILAGIAYVLVHLGVDDHSAASRAIGKLTADGLGMIGKPLTGAGARVLVLDAADALQLLATAAPPPAPPAAPAQPAPAPKPAVVASILGMLAGPMVALTLLLGLAACSQSQLAGFQTDIKLVDSGVQSLAPLLTAAGVKVPPALPGYVAQFDAAAQQVATAASADAAKPAVQQAVTAFNALVAIAATIPGVPPQYQAILAASAALLPGIEAAVGLTGAAPGALPMPPDAARLILAAPK